MEREKISKRVLKIIVFYSLSFLIANFFMAYLIGMDEVKHYIRKASGLISQLSPHYWILRDIFLCLLLVQGTGLHSGLSIRQAAGCIAR